MASSSSSSCSSTDGAGVAPSGGIGAVKSLGITQVCIFKKKICTLLKGKQKN